MAQLGQPKSPDEQKEELKAEFTAQAELFETEKESLQAALDKLESSGKQLTPTRRDTTVRGLLAEQVPQTASDDVDGWQVAVTETKKKAAAMATEREAIEKELQKEDIRNRAKSASRELREIKERRVEKANAKDIGSHKTLLGKAEKVLSDAVSVDIDTEQVFTDLNDQIARVEGLVDMGENALLQAELDRHKKSLDNLSKKINQLLDEDITNYPFGDQLKPIQEALDKLKARPGLEESKIAELESQITDMQWQWDKRRAGTGGGTNQQKAEKEVGAAINFIKHLISEVQSGSLEPDNAKLPSEVTAALSGDNLKKAGLDKSLEARQAQDEFERVRRSTKKEKAVDEAKGKLQLAHQWLDGFEPQAAAAGPLTREQIDELKRKYQETESADTNQVKQAKDYVDDKKLSTNDKVKPENNRMEERLRKLKEALEKHEQELLKKEVDDGVVSAESFLAEINKRGELLGENYRTIDQRQAEWAALKPKLEKIRNEANADAKVKEASKDQLIKLDGLIAKLIPEAMAGAAINVPREAAEKFLKDWEAVKTLEDLEKKIKEYKEKTEGGEVVLSLKEIVDDEKIDEWLRQRFTRDIVKDLEAALAYAVKNKLPGDKGKNVLIADRPDFKANVENLKLKAEELEEFLKKKNKELVEDKHRVRVREVGTSEEAQKGKAKLEGKFGITSPELAKAIDLEEVKKEEIFFQVIDTLLKEHSFWGKEVDRIKGGEGERDKRVVGHRVQEAESVIISGIIQALGPGSKYGFSEPQCQDLFHAAKQYIWERATADIERGPREEMPVVPTEGGYKTDKAETTIEQPKATHKRSWWKTLTGSLVRGSVPTAVGLAAAGPLGALAGLATTGVLRMVDNIVRSKVQQRRINEWKAEKRDDKEEKFKNGMRDHLAFTVANLKENQIRAMVGGGAQNYETYFNNTKGYLQGLNTERHKEGKAPLSAAEIDKEAAAFALYYAMDDRVETERMEHELTQSPNTRHWWNFIDRTLGVSLRGRSGRIGLKFSSPLDKFYAGSSALGVSFGLFAAKAFLPGPLGWGARRLTQAYAGWKYGGAIGDIIAGRKSAEIATEQKLAQLEAEWTPQRLQGMEVGKMGEPIKHLQECWATLSSVKNPIEYARQKERLKKIMLPVFAEKILKEEVGHDLQTTEDLRKKGGEIYQTEVLDLYTHNREAQLRDETQSERQRMLWRVLGAVALGLGGAIGEHYLEAWLQKRQAAAGDKVWGDKGWQDAGAHRPGAGSGGLPEAPGPGGPSRVEGIPAMAVVGHHEGVEHALGRQIEAHAEKFGYPGTGDKHAWAMGEAHRVALANDYFDDGGGDSGGAETRVRPEDRVAYFFEYGQDGKPVAGAGGKPVVHEVVGHFGPAGAFIEDIATRTPGPDEPAPEWYEYHHPKGVEPLDQPSGTEPGTGPEPTTGGPVIEPGSTGGSAPGAEGGGAHVPEMPDAQKTATDALSAELHHQPTAIDPNRSHELLTATAKAAEAYGLQPGEAAIFASRLTGGDSKLTPEDFVSAGLMDNESRAFSTDEFKRQIEKFHSTLPSPEAVTYGTGQTFETKLAALLPDANSRAGIDKFLKEPSQFPKGTRLSDQAMQELMNTNKTASNEYIRFRIQARIEDFINDPSNPAKLDALRGAVSESVVMEKSGPEAWQNIKDAFRGEKHEQVLKVLQEMVKGK